MSLDTETLESQNPKGNPMKFWQVEVHPFKSVPSLRVLYFLKEFIPSESESSPIYAYSRVDFAHDRREKGYYFLMNDRDSSYSLAEQIIKKSENNPGIIRGAWMQEVKMKVNPNGRR